MKPSQSLSTTGREALDSFMKRHVRDVHNFVTTISGDDEMYLYELSQSKSHDHDESHLRYFDSGRLMLSEYRPIVEGIFGSFEAVDSLLEFACGHGRFTRFLVQEMDPRKITASDIYEDAVAFQEAQFGVSSKLSCSNPDDFGSDQRYQLILVSSLFSHLPAQTFSRWLARLYSLLADDGVLVFSVHDAALLPAHLDTGDKGILFILESESRTLDRNEYGTTFVDESFVARVIREACPGADGYVRIKKGLWRYQDLYVVSCRGNRDIRAAGLNRGPRGYLDLCFLDASEARYQLGGWAFDFEESAVPDRIDVYAGTDLVCTSHPAESRLDVAAHFEDPGMADCGWSCQIDAARLERNDVITVEAVNSRGLSFVLTCDTLFRLCQQWPPRDKSDVDRSR